MVQPIYTVSKEQMSPDYLAGFFDGEGCIDTQRMYNNSEKYGKTLYVRPRVRVAQSVVGECVLQKLHRRFGGHISRRVSAKANHRDSISLEFLSEADVTRVLDTMLPSLVLKREQARLVLWWYQNCKGLDARSYSGIDTVRKMFANELRAMKHDPQRLSERAAQLIQTALMR